VEALLLPLDKYRAVANFRVLALLFTPILTLLLRLTRLQDLAPLPLCHHVVHPLPNTILHPKRQRPKLGRNEPRRLRRGHMLAPPRQHRLDDLLSHRLRVLRLAVEALEQRGARVARAHEHGADFGRFVVCYELSSETFVEGKSRGFGRRIIHHSRCGGVARQGGEGDDHAVVVLNHVRQELLGEVVVRKGIDLEGKADVLLGRLQDRLSSCDARIVDEDRGVAEFGADLGRGGRYRRRRGEVAVEVADGWRCCRMLIALLPSQVWRDGGECDIPSYVNF
jgi:hypothetical protein